MKELNVIVTDDHSIFREAVINLVKNFPGVAGVSGVGNGKELLDKLKTEHADIVILDLQMPVMTGLEAIDYLKRDYPETKIIVLSMSANDFHVKTMLDKDADAYLLKNVGAKEIELCFSVLMSGKKYYSAEILEKIKTVSRHKGLTSLKDGDLSERETEILKLICEQKSISEIAELLSIEAVTVRFHRANLLKKTGVNNDVGLLFFAVSNNLYSIYS